MKFETKSEFDEITEFEEMKIIWDSQNEEKLYAINESALYAQIKRKGKSISRLLERFEMVMIGVNLLVSVILVGMEFLNEGDMVEYLLPVLYLAYAVVVFVWRYTRRQKDNHFEKSMLGELDKAIWQIDYLIKRTRDLMLWYLLPLTLLIVGTMLYKGQLLFALAIILLMSATVFFTDRWEIKRCYLPKKQSLESLRTKLTAAEA